MAYSREFAQDEVDRFNSHYETLPPEKQEMFSGASHISVYEGCSLCGRNEFREFREGDCPDGCTIGPVIWERE